MDIKILRFKYYGKISTYFLNHVKLYVDKDFMRDLK